MAKDALISSAAMRIPLSPLSGKATRTTPLAHLITVLVVLLLHVALSIVGEVGGAARTAAAEQLEEVAVVAGGDEGQNIVATPSGGDGTNETSRDDDNGQGAPANEELNAAAYTTHHYRSVHADPIPDVPCEVFVAGYATPFAAIKKNIVTTLRDVAAGSISTLKTNTKNDKDNGSATVAVPTDLILANVKALVCPRAMLTELRGYIENAGGTTGGGDDSTMMGSGAPARLDQMGTTVRAMGMAHFERLGEQCASDLLLLSDALQHWSSELGALSAAVQHAAAGEDCSQAWAHFAAFMARSGSLALPLFRSEQCMFVDEYRACFDVPKPVGKRAEVARPAAEEEL